MSVCSETLAFQDSIMVRVFKSSQNFKVELTSELNISFFYQLELAHKELCAVAEQDITDELAWFALTFSPNNKYQLRLDTADYARLTVLAQEKFKNYELAALEFSLADAPANKLSVMYRYERMRAREKLLDTHWDTLCGVIRTKNPSLLLQLEHRIRKNAFK